MNYLSPDHLIVYAFLFVTLLIGIWAGRGIKDIRDYAIASKQFGTGALTVTLLATYIGGWHLVGFPSDVFADGLIQVLPEVVCGVVVCLLFIAWFIAPKLVHFKDCLTMGDLMLTFYGEYGQMITGVLGLVYNTTAVSIQILFFGYVCEPLGINSDWGLALAVLLLTIYTAKGGMRAVTMTDILQFTAIIAALPLLAHLVTYQAGGVEAMISNIPQEKLQLLNFGQEKEGSFSASYYAFPILTLWFLFPGFPLSFPFIQRMLMAKDERQATSIYYIGIGFLVSFFFLLTLIGLAALAVYPQINSQDVLSHIVSNLPVGLKGLVWVALLAVIMSTTDSFLHAAGVSLTHDLIAPLAKKREIGINELKVAQYTTLIVGCLAIIVALSIKDIAKIAMYGMDVAALLFTIPLIAGIMGLKTAARTFIVSLFATLTAFVFTKLYLGEDLVIPICILVNMLSFFGDHYLQHKGFVVVKRGAGQSITHVWRPSWKTTFRSLTELTPTPQKLLRYSQDKASQYGITPVTFGLFIAFSYMVPLFMHSYADPITYNWLLTIRGIGTLLCVGLFLQSQWPAFLLPYFPVYYYFTLLYCLPFVTTFLFFLEGGSIEWLLNVGLSIMLLIVLADWAMFVGLSIVGIALAMGLYKLAIGPVSMHMDLTTNYTFFYAVTFSTLIGLLFARRKEQRITQVHSLLKGQGEAHQASLLRLAAENQSALKALQNTGVSDLLAMAKELHALDVKKAGLSKLEALESKLIPMAFQIQGIDTRSQDYLRLHIKEYRPIEELLNSVKNSLQENGIQASVKVTSETQHQKITGDAEQLVNLLSKSMASLQGAIEEEEQTILMALEDTQLSYPLPDVEKGYIKSVLAVRIAITVSDDLPVVKDSYMAELSGSSQTPVPETVEGLAHAANSRIVKAHYGYEEVTDDTLIYVIPLDVREVRPRDMDKAYMEVDATPKRSNDHYKSDTVDAQAQEAMFLTDVAARSDADLGLVKMALELIKWYHGPSERKSGEPFYLHPLAVAQIVLDYSQDEATIIGALLHDTVEDTPMLLQHIETVFGKETSEVVDLVTHLQSIEGSIYKIKMSASENLQMLDRTGNKLGLYVKLADRMHNMRTINGHPKVSKRKLVAQETADFFVPLAKKLGLTEAAAEFEKMCLEVLKQKE